ncbi:ATP-dependent DNA helicase RecG [Proteinivorax hydrogeniformans]|uniref:ATP-dependent DNA helicase RecG n=1 Tax=Proteinivorax hydrogeniformans TaxID=1826727 RepID=A0AAU8HPN1_9FIRM
MDRDIQYLKGVGPKRARLFRSLGIETIKDLLFYLPREVENVQNVSSAGSKIEDKAKVALTGVVVTAPSVRRIRGNLSMLTTEVSDSLGRYKLVWFNQPFLKSKLAVGKTIKVKGVYNKKYRQITVNEYNFSNQNINSQQSTGSLQPIYPITEGLNQKLIQQSISIALKNHINNLTDPIPKEIIEKYKLLGLRDSLLAVHQPKSKDQWLKGKKRFIFEELLTFKSALLIAKKRYNEQQGIEHYIKKDSMEVFSKVLGFELTGDQKKVMSEISKDMASSTPMNRLLQGDVGSGKTIVAAYSLYLTVVSGCQGVLMVPTEILAEQHYYNLKSIFNYFNINVELLTSSSKDKIKVYERLKKGEVDIVVGTHAILQEGVKFNKLALIVTDEQHRFGVKQRAVLRGKGSFPDVLVMSATPIPRTMAQMLYGDLDISSIKQLPKGRKPIKTYSTTPNNRNRVFEFIKKEVEKGQQCYIVCPLVDESEKVSGLAATQYFQLVDEYFGDISVGLLHGKMSSQQKEQVMTQFKNGEISILVATTVIEVGVDVKNANIMVIENSEKFGLSQLHQLRGRVGRGQFQSFCILICHTNSSTANKRMKIMTETSDGFKISQADLKLRGPGEFFGTRQHGVPEFKYFDMLNHMDYIQPATEAAQLVLENLSKESYHRFLKKIHQFADNYFD